MKRISLIVSAAVFFLASCNNDHKPAATSPNNAAKSTKAPVSPKNAPVIKFEETNYNFGKIAAGEKVSHEFKFTNAGKSPLIISNATASCGCTVPDYPHEPIMPGSSSVIKVVFNSEGKSGMQNKIVTITANTVPEATEVYIVGEVTSKK